MYRPCSTLLILLFVGGDYLPAAERMNVLVIICDDLNTRLGPYGFPGIMTPTLDRFASESMTFTRTHCQYPVCGPSRASLLSGLYPESTGVINNKAEITAVRPGTPNLPATFRQAGYWTAATGKVFHNVGENPGDTPETAAWDVATKFENDEMPIERQARLAFEKEHGPATSPKNRAAWREHLLTVAPQTRNQGLVGVGPGYGASGLTDEQQSDGKNVRQVVEWITGKANGSKPFFIACGIQKPHIPVLAPDAYHAMYPKNTLTVPSDPFSELAALPKLAPNHGWKEWGFTSDHLNRDLALDYIQAYHACISYIDCQIDLVFQALKTSGQWDNTIVVFTSDHGFQLGEHYEWGKVTLFDVCTHVPLIIRAPGVTKAGSRSAALSELVDLFPTLSELCHVPGPANLQGRSLVPCLRDVNAAGKEATYCVVTRGKQPVIGRSIQFQHYRYAEWGSAQECELYDHDSDAGEHRNLAKDPAQQPTLIKARALMQDLRAYAVSASRPMPTNQSAP
jgi:iduronate 2-sulfatase